MAHYISSEILYLGCPQLLTGQDTKIRFSVDPYPGDPGYTQWKDAMKMVARLPEGVPQEFRKKVGLRNNRRESMYVRSDKK